MLPVFYDAQYVENIIHILHVEAEHERLARQALALRAAERAAANRGRLAPMLTILDHAFGLHLSDPEPRDRRN